MDKKYQPHKFEEKHYKCWEENGYFKPQGKGDPYCIVIPPPNVTGTLHMGHAFQDTIMDSLTRYHRICLLYTSPSPRDATLSRMPSSA